MKAEDKKKWVEALRSGDYKQGVHALRDYDDKYCCLGVACEIFGMKAKKNSDLSLYDYGKNSSYLPVTLVRRLGLGTNGELPKPVQFKGITHTDLVGLNDAGASFKKIAQIIERLF